MTTSIKMELNKSDGQKNEQILNNKAFNIILEHDFSYLLLVLDQNCKFYIEKKGSDWFFNTVYIYKNIFLKSSQKCLENA